MANETQPTQESSEVSEQAVLDALKSRPAVIKRIAKFIFNRYGSELEMGDVSEKALPDRIDFLLTRALAAHTIAALTGQDAAAAASCIVDGGQDLGIDAICFDETQKRVWLVQSKFHKSGSGEISWSDVSKFLDGCDDLFSDNFGHANPKILAFTSEIKRAVTEPGWKFTLVLAATSVDPLSNRNANGILEKLLYQDPGKTGTFSFRDFSLNDITESVEKSFDAAKVNLKIELHHWGCVTDPFVAYYGQVPIDAVISWKHFGASLFEKNLRGFLGASTQISESIAATLESRSEIFWYLNNGATVLCERIQPCGPYSLEKSRAKAVFECTGVSVVNGAQTIGTIWGQPAIGGDLDPRAMVHLRLISLESAPADFAQQVTKATNTQKNILARDFATFDTAQRRLYREFRMDGRKYAFRQGDPDPAPEDGCSIDELALALACRHSIELATIAYRNFGFLTDPENHYYKVIFGVAGKPTADDAWHAVKILRAANVAIKAIRETQTLTGKEKQVATHGERYIQFRAFNDSSVKSLRGVATATDPEIQAVVQDVINSHFRAVLTYIRINHDRDYLQVFFKNTSKVRTMDEALSTKPLPGMGPIRQRELSPDLYGSTSGDQ